MGRGGHGGGTAASALQYIHHGGGTPASPRALRSQARPSVPVLEGAGGAAPGGHRGTRVDGGRAGYCVSAMGAAGSWRAKYCT